MKFNFEAVLNRHLFFFSSNFFFSNNNWYKHEKLINACGHTDIFSYMENQILLLKMSSARDSYKIIDVLNVTTWHFILNLEMILMPFNETRQIFFFCITPIKL